MIKSSYNHSTNGHNVKDVVVTIAYYDSIKQKFNTFDIAIHYCQNCERYFDFKVSFENQLKSIGLKLEDITIAMYDDYMVMLNLQSFDLRDKSTLRKYGYHVGRSGLARNKRQELLQFMINLNIMTKAQIKNFLEYLIRYNGSKSNMEEAIKDWKDDIEFVNQLIIKR